MSNDWMHRPKCLPRDAIHSAVFAVMQCPSQTVCPLAVNCRIDVSKRPNLLSNFFIAWWPHHSSFPKMDPTVKFRRALNRGANWGGVPKIICDFQPVFQKYRYRIPNRHEKNTDENTEYRYRLQIPIPTQLYYTQATAFFINTIQYSFIKIKKADKTQREYRNESTKQWTWIV